MVSPFQLTILLAEAALVGGVVLLLYWLRRFIGLAPLFIAVGAFQYLQVVLAASVYVELLPGVWVSPGSVVLFPATIFAVLLIYVQEDAYETRKLAYGLVVCNIALFAVSLLAGQHLTAPGHQNLLNLHPRLFSQSARIVAAGVVALFLDIIGTIVVFEFVSRFTRRWLFVQVWVSLVAIMALDSLVFATGAFLGQENYVTVMASGFVGKGVFATCYTLLLVGYARLIEVPGRDPAGDSTLADVFQMLTYRQRYEEARHRMTRDALTGLFNRGYFNDYAPKQAAQAARHHEPMSLVLIDADHLKNVNDRYGHSAGDRLICVIADVIRDFVRRSDTACRYGGDEFAVVLTAADGRAASVFAERLVARLEAHARTAHLPFPPQHVSVTVGIATCPAEATTVADLVAVADKRLYEGKRRGGRSVIGATLVGAPERGTPSS
jgi:diguanylate cyclase (GGDEF)-like protein